jgi:hypothetical protein
VQTLLLSIAVIIRYNSFLLFAFCFMLKPLLISPIKYIFLNINHLTYIYTVATLNLGVICSESDVL